MLVNLAVEAVVVAGRHRRELGDLDSLMESIRERGLLHPIVVTPEWGLVVGERRLEAFRRLGRDRIPATVATNLADAAALLAAERDENTCRKDMAPSEMVALGVALEALEGPRAEERRIEGNRNGGKGGREVEETFTPTSTRGQVRDIVGAAVGVSGPTYARAKAVVEVAARSDLPPEAQEVARKALAHMDRTGKVGPAYNQIAPLIGRKPDYQTKAQQPALRPPSDKPLTPRQRNVRNAQKLRLERALSGISGFCRGLQDIDLDNALSALSEEERDMWAKKARSQSRQLLTLARAIQPPEIKNA